jgi:DNA polymerase elongation subunit (family B)
MEKDFRLYYSTLGNIDDPFDELFYNNTETPFRFTSTTLSLRDSIYQLSTKHNIPLVGGVTIDESYLTDNYPFDYLPSDTEISGIDYKDIKHIKRNDTIDLKHKMRVLSYDIETHNVDGNMEPTDNNPITCIGFGLFSLSSTIPIKRVSLISKPFTSEDLNKLGYPESRIVNSRKCYKIYNEYFGNEHNLKDKTTYVICKNESDLLEAYLEYIEKYKPNIISGFNIYGFDDKWVHYKMKQYNFETRFLQTFTPYDLEIMKEVSWFREFVPTFRKFLLKLDGDIKNDNASVRGGVVLTADIYKILLKADPRRYTQYGRGNLDTMLKVNNIKNPINNQELQKTGLKINEMFRLWDLGERIYDIALYCCQDAWICGTLLIKTAKINDFIEMALISHTSLNDSIFRADSRRVQMSILYYAYNYGFAFSDSTYRYRDDIIKEQYNHLINDKIEEPLSSHLSLKHDIKFPNKGKNRLGGRNFDTRTIVGGCVRNVHPGKHWFVVALDFSSMYPSQKEGSNIDSSAMIDSDVIKNHSKYGIKLLSDIEICDMYGNRHIYTFEHKDKVYNVEEFKCEYKNNKEELKKLFDELKVVKHAEKAKIVNKMIMLCPELAGEKHNIIAGDYELKYISNIERKPIYCVQSPKGPDGLPTIHYSLKEKMLSDLRAERTKVKKLEATEKDNLLRLRWTLKQNNIKVVSNAEYGASGNKQFAHYDPNVAAGVTYCSRQLISFLTTILQTEVLYVDKQFIKDNENDIDPLIKIGFIKIENVYLKNESRKTILESYRTQCLRRLFDADYNVINDEIIKLNLHPSTVIYQDTDSNYYTNDYIVNHFIKRDDKIIINPQIINDCMKMLIHHNNFYSKFIEFAVQRRPISLSFEGAFIVCRYLNRKKKYYGIKWYDGMKHTLCKDAYVTDSGEDLSEISDIDLIEGIKNKEIILKKDYQKYWKPKTTVPQPDGYYIKLNEKELLGNSSTNYLDYVQSFGVKCTGVDLARRDQFRFVNFSHLYTLQRDLSVISYDGENFWSVISKNTSMIEVVESILKSFFDTIKYCITLSKHIINKYDTDGDILNLNISRPEIVYGIIDFCKTVTYKPDKRGPLIEIIQRLHSENKEKYIPQAGERTSFLVIESEKVKRIRMEGRSNVGNTSSRSYLIQELLDDLHERYPENRFPKTTTNTEDIDYESFIEKKIISMLDIKYYYTSLVQALSLYIIGDKYPREIKSIDNGDYNIEDEVEMIDKFKKLITKEYVDKAFPSGRVVTKVIKELKSNYQQISKQPLKQRNYINSMSKKQRDEWAKELKIEVTNDNYKQCQERLCTLKDKYEKACEKYLTIVISLMTCPALNVDLMNKYKERREHVSNELIQTYENKVKAYKKNVNKYEKLLSY